MTDNPSTQNQRKWEAAYDYCKMYDWEFLLVTSRELRTGPRLANISIMNTCWCIERPPLTDFEVKKRDLTKYSNPDNDPRGPWLSGDLTGLATKSLRPNHNEDLVDPSTGLIYPLLSVVGALVNPQ